MSNTLGGAVTWGGLNVSGASGAVTINNAGSTGNFGVLTLGSTSLSITGTLASGIRFSSLSGTGTLTLNSGSTALNTGILQGGADALNFNGTLALRGGTATTSTGTVSGHYFALGQLGGVTTLTQAAGTAFALDTGAAVANAKDIIFDGSVWNGKTVNLTSLTGYGSIRSDSGAANPSTYTLAINQNVDTTFNGLVMSHVSNASVVRNLSLTKSGTGKLTLAGIVGKETINSADVNAAVNLAVSGTGTLELTAANTRVIGTTTIGAGATLLVSGSGTLGGSRTASNTYTAGTFAGNVTDDGTLTFSGTAANTLSGIVSGTGALNKSGSGTLTLTGANTYSGATTITGGTLTIGSAGQLGSGGIYSGAITLTGTLDHASSTNQTLSGNISGTGGVLTKSGSATLTLSGTNTYTGATTISAGVLNLTGSLTSAVTATGGAVAGTGSTTGSLTLNGGTIFLAGGATTSSLTSNGVTFSVPTALYFVSLPLASTNYDVVTYGAGGVTNFGNLTASYRGTLNNDTLNQKIVFASGGAETRTWNTTTGTWDNYVTANFVEGDQKFAGGDTVVFNEPAADSVITLSGHLIPTSVTVNNTANKITFTGVDGTSDIAGLGSLAKSGAGTLEITTAQTYSGGTTVNAGVLTLTGTGTLGSGSVTLNGGSITGANTISGSSYAVNAGAISAILGGTGALTKGTAGTVTLSGANTYSGTTTVNAGKLKIGDGGTAGNIGSGAVTVASGATLEFNRTDLLDYKTNARMRTVSGAGDIVLKSGVKLFNYTGSGVGFAEASSWVNFSGRLIVLDGSEFQTIRNGRTAMGTAQIILGDATTSGKLSQIEGNWTWTNNIQLEGPANEIINYSAVAASARFLKIQGVISGSGNLTFKDSTGALSTNNVGTVSGDVGVILTGANTANGTMTVDTFVRVGGVAGDDTTTTAGTGGTLGSASVVINSGKRLTFSRSDAHTVNNAISGAGAVYVGSIGITGSNTQVLTLSGTNTYTGGTELMQGTLAVDALSRLGTRTAAFDNTGYLAIKNGSTFRYTGTGSESTDRRLYMDNGAATIDLVDAGATLTWDDDSDVAKTGNFTKTGAGTLVLADALTGTGQTVTVAAGRLTLSATHTYTGATLVNGGILQLDGQLTSAITVASGAQLQGTGSTTGGLNISGTVSPGNSIESLGIGGNVSFDATSTLKYELDSVSLAGDLLAANAGSLSITTGAILLLSELNVGTLNINDKLTLISYNGTWDLGVFKYMGNPLANDSPITLNNNVWLFKYNDTSGGTNFSGEQTGAMGFVTMTVIPEPGTMGIVAVFLAAALLKNRRPKQQ